jgi:hypothetical protein
LVHHQTRHLEVHEEEGGDEDNHTETVQTHCKNIEHWILYYIDIEQQKWYE